MSRLARPLSRSLVALAALAALSDLATPTVTGAQTPRAAPPAAAPRAPTSAGAPSAAFARFVDRYLDDWARRHPSIAAGNGIHAHDGRLEDFSAAAIRAEVAALRRDRATLAAFDPARLTADERVDRRILLGVIDGWLLEQATLENWRRNPMLYASALADGVHNLMAMASDPAPVRMRRVVTKLAGVPALMAAARANVADPPRLLAERGLAMLRGASALLARDLPLAFADSGTPALRDSLRRAAAAAIPHVDGYAAHLERVVIPRATGDFVVGADALARRYAAEELIDTPLPTLVAIGERELARTQAAFREAAARVDPARDPLAVWAEVRRDHPRPGELVAATRRAVDSLAAFVVRRELAALPPAERLVVEPALPFDLGFASMHASPPLEATPVRSVFYLTDASPTAPPAEQDAWLERFNHASLFNLAAHEAIPGHWLHSTYMRRTPGKVRRIWIGLNPFPQPSSGQDGWAHYAEQMVLDEGFGGGDARLRMAQLADALTRICRLLAGVKVHTRAWTLADAERCFAREAHLATPAARREAERAAYDPTYGGYFLGKMAMLQLRADVERREGARFDLRTFHERVMTNGIAPVWAHRQLLLPGDTGALLR